MTDISQNYTERRNVQIETDNLVLGILTFIGTTLMGMVVKLWHKVNGQTTRTAILEENKEQNEVRRLEERDDRAVARAEMKELIGVHHKTVIDKIDTISNRVDSVEKLIRNGH